MAKMGWFEVVLAVGGVGLFGVVSPSGKRIRQNMGQPPTLYSTIKVCG